MGANENLTIVFTDIVNYTAITGALSRADSQQLMQRHDSLLLPVVNAYQGRRVKAIGDAMLLTFRSPTDAIHCSMAMQDTLAEARRQDAVNDNLHIRIAINLGEVRAEKSDVFGEPVNIAARLESLVPADEVYFSEAVYLAMNKAEVPSEFVGEHALKGIPEPVRVYRVPTHTYSRLVPSGPANPEADLPFGGVHLPNDDGPRERSVALLQNSWSSLRSWGQTGAALAADFVGRLRRRPSAPAFAHRTRTLLLVLLLASSALLLVRSDIQPLTLGPTFAASERKPTPTPLLAVARTAVDQGEALLENEQWDALEALVAQRLKLKAEDPAALLLRGHRAFLQSERAAGARDYAAALAQAPELANNPRLAANLVAALGWINPQAIPLLLEYQSEQMLNALARRSGQAGFQGRTQAIALLRDLDREDLIDHYNHALEELRGRSRCEDRLNAVKALRKLADPAAIPSLEAARGEGLKSWWENRCLRGELAVTLKELKARRDASRPAD